MKLQFKHQKFQADAAKAVVDIFEGQPYTTQSYMMDPGSDSAQMTLDGIGFTGWANGRIDTGKLPDKVILERIQKRQRLSQIEPSKKLEGHYNLTIEMETGTGKTYTYIKTMYELNKAYGWTKFIVVVPSIAIREGVYKSFQITQEHFADEYGKKIRFFIYNSARLTEIEQFASDNAIHVMIINSQAFNAKGKDARRIYMRLDEFRSRKPIDVIAQTNPILIIDEPQSVEGKETKKRLEDFKPLFTLRYSATHRDTYNMIYRLDAMDAYNRHLVKKIAVKGIAATGTTATDSYVYLESINLSKAAPTATLSFDCKAASGIRKVTRTVGEGYSLFDNSGSLDEYKGFVVSHIDGRDNSVEFINGIKIFAGDVIGQVDEMQLRRIQIRETIISHLEQERMLFHRGIKVLSLFFIDEVDHYRQYDEAGQACNGVFADMFEEEYADVVSRMYRGPEVAEYIQYIDGITPKATHAGYFSVDKQKHMINSKVGRKETSSDDVDAYDLIMKDKEKLLDRAEPVRFIFSHSALKEGWDNPNVFQICTLKQSGSDIRKRQEVGRGLRLCVDRDGRRMDEDLLGVSVHEINILTVIASESYESFAKGLQSEMAETIGDRPEKVTASLFAGRKVTDDKGETVKINDEMAVAIHYSLIMSGYVDSHGALTDKYYEDRKAEAVVLPEEAKAVAGSVIDIIDSVYRPIEIENSRKNNVTLKVSQDKLAMKEFKELWQRINSKTAYKVEFDTGELIRKCIASLDANLHVAKIEITVTLGVMDDIESKSALTSGTAMCKVKSASAGTYIGANAKVKYDLVGKIVDETGLTRKTVVAILQGIKAETFNQFKTNPEEFIIRAAHLIRNEMATVIVEHITYSPTDDEYGTEIFTEPTIRGVLNKNTIKVQKHLYDYVRFDSDVEKQFAEAIDIDENVAVYVKLPGGFTIPTPVGNYNPDWAIAFYEGTVKHIYFVAETKGSMDSLDLKSLEQAKIYCARQHFKAISGEKIKYDVVSSYGALLEMVKG